MSEPYVGEIRMFAGTFAPRGYIMCDGRLLPIAQYNALFALIGTTYGGDGVTTFGVPNLCGRVPVHAGSNAGNNYVQGQLAGSETVTLTGQQNPAHIHTVVAQTNANATTPSNGVYGGGVTAIYRASPASAMNNSMVGITGGQPHDNLMPFLVINFILAVEGVFPPHN